ncbi:uncharacterized protein Z519_02678 [Cladophialophora bantiana CBS 173.52]|uniref:Uncharacterized protein n=1 Tax=Cladophialophora bantiana (strain ATCC 10958 / CBS 173.52 / CDC B-1940 / NIH 8579) TaxID=1442370 RepID=A0A0D2F4V6_CLAB1|nr:uncharacterized protein Z519_02678 [Cladophialophora bantiana CBS 173.52]KIW97286.1 hypothetical protein Z519_02678 [Cladophialophora bantiana CBS 173.52]
MKHLYHSLHHPEELPDSRNWAHKCLDSLLSQTSNLARQHWEQNRTEKVNRSILCLRNFSKEGLRGFLEAMNIEIQDEWERYVLGRRAGNPRELFQTVHEASQWIKKISPVKLVDGAWLGHLRLSLIPFSLQPVLRDLWQILSEELGDGDMAKNHVYVFKELLLSVDHEFPNSDSEDFIRSAHLTDNLSTWNSALAQLTISLFPQDYIPEILGFNLHFELVTLETLKATKELKEVGLDPCYFFLHVCIDNTDSGHSAIAFRAVCHFMDYIREVEGEAAARRDWKRIQNGFCLSQFSTKLESPPDAFLPSEHETKLVNILTNKVQASRKVHCNSPARIKGRLIGDWLDPQMWQSPSWRLDFLHAFSCDEQWIFPGDSHRSRFIQVVSPGGKMFGSFTVDEREVLREWIDNLSPKDDVKTENLREESQWLRSEHLHPEQDMRLSVKISSNNSLIYERVLPLWFAACSLLEGFVSVPTKAATQLALSVLKVLRVQNGFRDCDQDFAPTNAAAERDPLHTLSSIGLIMIESAGFGSVSSLAQILEMWPLDFSSKMVELSRRPEENKAILIGMSLAFAEFHAQVSSSQLLERTWSEALRTIAESEIRHLTCCRRLLEDEGYRRQLEAGYKIATIEIHKSIKDGKESI